MASIIQQKYPSTSSVSLTITLASLATSSTLLVGRESGAVDNTTNLDTDHMLSGKITVGTSPTVSTKIEVLVYAPISMASGTPTYPDVFDGTESAETVTSDNVKFSMLRLAWSTTVDATSDRTYYMEPTSIKDLFGDLPPFWGVFVTHSTGVNLNSTGGNHDLSYFRIQKQIV